MLRMMEISNYPEMCGSSIDHSPSSTRTKRLGGASRSEVSLYPSLLRRYREILFTDDAKSDDDDDDDYDDDDSHGDSNETIQWGFGNSGRVGHRQRSGSCQETSHHHGLVGSRNSASETFISCESSRTTWPPTSLYPTVIDDITGDDHHGLYHCLQYDSLQRQSCNENGDNGNVNNFEMDEKGALLPSQSPRSVRGHDESTDNSGNLTADSKAISSFYRAALEEVALQGEEEIVLLQQRQRKHQHQHQNNHSQLELLLETIDDSSTIITKVNQTVSRPSSFYQSAVTEVIMAENEQGREEESEKHMKSPNIVPVTNETATSIPQRSREPELRSNLTLGSTTNLNGRLWNKDRAMPVSTSTFSSSSDVSPVEVEPISINQRTPSFIDENDEASVTRSMVIPQLKNSFLPSMQERSVLNDKNCDEDCQEELRLEIYLSRFKLSTDSPPYPGKAHSAPLSTGSARSETDNNDEFLVSQLKAMEDCQKNIGNRGISRPSSDSPISGKSHSVSPKGTTTHVPLSSSGERIRARWRNRLETRGVSETKNAISNGRSHIVKCKGCSGRLQAPIQYSLVFCPKCKTVSPA